jgi:hypothetical protein
LLFFRGLDLGDGDLGDGDGMIVTTEPF